MRFSTLAAICRELDCQHIPHVQRLGVCALNRIEFARREIDLAAGRPIRQIVATSCGVIVKASR